jgi:hypothetical protein
MGQFDGASPLIQGLQAPLPDLGGALMGGINQGIMRPLQMQQVQQQYAQQQAAFSAQQAALADPSPQNIVKWQIADPTHSDAAAAAHTAQTSDAQRANIIDGSFVYNSLRAAIDPAASETTSTAAIAAAKARIQQRVDAGQTELQPLLGLIDTNPKAAAAISGSLLASFTGDKFAETAKAMGEESRANQEEPYVIQAKRLENAKNSFLPVVAGTQEVPLSLDQPGQPGSPQPAANGQPAQGAQGPATIPGPAAAQVAAAAQAAGASPGMVSHLGVTAALESRGNPNAKNGSSTGIFQMQPKTFAALGGTDINDVGQQTAATIKLAQQNAQQMQHMLGRAPTNSDVYLAHQQGATGASALIANPDTNAIQALVGAGVPAAKARASILHNGGTADMSAGQFVQMWKGKYNAVANAQGGASAPDARQTQTQAQTPTAQHYGSPGQGFTLGAPLGSNGQPDQATIQQAAEDWIRTGKTPNDGTRPEGIAINNAIMSLGNQLLQQRGIAPGQLSAMRTRWQSADTNFSSLQAAQGQMEVQEGTVKNGLGIASDLLKSGAGGCDGCEARQPAAWRAAQNPRRRSAYQSARHGADDGGRRIFQDPDRQRGEFGRRTQER